VCVFSAQLASALPSVPNPSSLSCPKELPIFMNYPLSRTLSLLCLLAAGTASAVVAQTSPAPVPNAPSAGGAAAAAPAGPAKIAVIEFQPAVAQTNEGQRDFAELRKKYEPKQAQIKQMSDEIDTLKKSLQTAGANLSETERATRLKTIDDKEKALQRTGEDAQNDYQQEVQQTFAQVAEKVFGTVQSYAQQNGYTLVVDASQQQSPVLRFNQGTDITAAVVQAYNAKSGVPAPAAAAPSAPSSTTPRRPAASTPAPR
jgi:outer membrane protein